MRLIDADKLLEKVYTIENGGIYGDCEVVDRYEIENAPTVSENGLIAKDYIQEKMFFVKREYDNQPIPVIAVNDLVAFERPQGEFNLDELCRLRSDLKSGLVVGSTIRYQHQIDRYIKALDDVIGAKMKGGTE